MSKDGVNWETLRDHVDDQSLNEPGSVATWKIEYTSQDKEATDEEEGELKDEEEKEKDRERQGGGEEGEEAAKETESSPPPFCLLPPKEGHGLGWRHVRIQQNGKNASGQTHYLSLSGLELYGTVTGVCEELGKHHLACRTEEQD